MFVFITIVCSNGFRKRLCWLVKKKGIFMLVQWAHARRTTIIDNSTIQKSSMSKNGVSWIVYYHIKIRSSSVNKWNKSLKGKSCKLYGILEKRFLESPYPGDCFAKQRRKYQFTYQTFLRLWLCEWIYKIICF